MSSSMPQQQTTALIMPEPLAPSQEKETPCVFIKRNTLPFTLLAIYLAYQVWSCTEGSLEFHIADNVNLPTLIEDDLKLMRMLGMGDGEAEETHVRELKYLAEVGVSTYEAWMGMLLKWVLGFGWTGAALLGIALPRASFALLGLFFGSAAVLCGCLLKRSLPLLGVECRWTGVGLGRVAIPLAYSLLLLGVSCGEKFCPQVLDRLGPLLLPHQLTPEEPTTTTLGKDNETRAEEHKKFSVQRNWPVTISVLLFGLVNLALKLAWIRRPLAFTFLFRSPKVSPAPSTTTPGDSPYAVLKVPQSASQAEISTAFHKLSLQYYPDKVSSRKSSGKQGRIDAGATLIPPPPVTVPVPTTPEPSFPSSTSSEHRLVLHSHSIAATPDDSNTKSISERDAEQMFKTVLEAHQLLSNTHRRLLYDLYGCKDPECILPLALLSPQKAFAAAAERDDGSEERAPFTFF